MTDFNSVPEFDSDLARLSKKYPSLNSDVERLKSVLRVRPPKELRGAIRISDLGAGVSDPVYKARHFRCESLRGKGCKSGISDDQDARKMLERDIHEVFGRADG